MELTPSSCNYRHTGSCCAKRILSRLIVIALIIGMLIAVRLMVWQPTFTAHQQYLNEQDFFNSMQTVRQQQAEKVAPLLTKEQVKSYINNGQ